MAILEGTSGNNTIIGTAGNDEFYSYGGDDSMISGGGNDLFYGDGGKDTIDGGTGNSGVTYAYDTVGVKVNLLTNVNTGGYAEGDKLYNIKNVVGGSANDTIVGTNLGGTLNGMAGNDSIVGGTGNDYSDGGAGSDSIATGAGNDTIFGGAGNNVLDAGAGNDIITGGTGNDQFYSGTGDDSMVAGGGNDLFYGDLGKDTINGGTGNSGITYSYDTVGVSVNLLTNVNTGGYAEGDKLYSINNVVGGSANDTIVGSNIGGTLNGMAGNDSITAGAGNDYSDAGDGNDTVFGGAGTDSLIGGAGNDKLDGGTGNDTLTGGAGADLFVFGAQANTADIITDFSTSTAGEKIDLTAFGYTSFSQIKALMTQVGADVQIGLPSSETITLKNVTLASLTFSHFVGVTSNDGIVTGTAGNDTITTTTYTDTDGDKVTAGNDTILALGGNDYVIAGAGNDSIDGGIGDDTLEGGVGADTIVGGTGYNLLSYYNDTVGVNVNLATQTASGGEAQGDVFSGIQAVLGGYGNDTLIASTAGNLLVGDIGNDYIAGGTGNDQLDGGTENDTLYGGGGSDTFSGGAGNDQVVAGSTMGSSSAAITAYLGDGADTFSDATSYVYLIPPANVFSSLYIDAGTGNDVINLYAANVTNATIAGGDGDDSIVAVDRIVSFDSNGVPTNAAILQNGYIDGGNGNDTISVDSTGQKIIYSGSGADRINFHFRSNGQQDNIDAGADNDTVTLFAQDTAQNYITGSLVDQLYVTLGDGADLFTRSYALVPTSQVIVDGGAGADTLHGTGSADTLIGGAGADVLYGATGGADVFVVAFENGVTDVIHNFKQGEDKIHIDTTDTIVIYSLGLPGMTTFGVSLVPLHNQSSGTGVWLEGYDWTTHPLTTADFI
jgi:Ca2+-binding RTX toxin-like protein